MKENQVIRGLLSMVLAAALVFSFLTVPANANEENGDPVVWQETIPIGEEPQSTEMTQAAEETQPPETTQASEETQPPETTQTAEETQPPETTQAAEETQLPETSPETEDTLPTETEAPAEETVPQETEADPVQSEDITLFPMTIRQAKKMEPGTPDIVIDGIVVCADWELTILQDQTGGIPVILPKDTAVRLGEYLRVQGTAGNTGLLAERIQRKGTRELPAQDSTLADAPEYIRLWIQDATFENASLTQGGVTVPMTPARPEGIEPGDRVNAWGVMAGGWFHADRIELLNPDPDPLPLIGVLPEGNVLKAGETIRLYCIETATGTQPIQIYYSLSLDGGPFRPFVRYSGEITVPDTAKEIVVRAYAARGQGDALETGIQTETYFAREAVSENGENWNFYFGQLHAHSRVSGGRGSVAEVFAAASQVEGLDFFAVTDHSNVFDNAQSGSINADGNALSETWKAGKLAAAAVTSEDFLGLYGYEMAWQNPRNGHISTFGTAGWQTRDQEGMDTLKGYYECLTTAPGSISQFNHPSLEMSYFWGFQDYDPKYDSVVQLLEVPQEFNTSNWDAYGDALNKGWHVAPTNNQANPKGTWEEDSGARTVILAESLTEESLFSAIRARRVYAALDPDLEVTYRLNGSIMGSTIKEEPRIVTLTLMDPTDSGSCTVEVMAEGEEKPIKTTAVACDGKMASILVPPGHDFYYLRILRNGQTLAVTAPVWVDLSEDIRVIRFEAESNTPVQNRQVKLTLELANKADVPLYVQKLEYFLGEKKIHSIFSPPKVPAKGNQSYEYFYPCDTLGPVTITVKATGTLLGKEVTCNASVQLTVQSPEAETSTIGQVRKGKPGKVYCVRGYVTAGTSNPYNTFPGMLYLQDDTGGIAVTEFLETGIQVGTPLEVTGYLNEDKGNLSLVRLNHRKLDEDYCRIVPQTVYNSRAMDYAAHGGQLQQVEGQVVSLTRTADNQGISKLTIKDVRGDLAKIRIEDTIFSGATGENRLTRDIRAGRTVRAMGLLHYDTDGSLVLRVRNCDEVVYVPPLPDPSNPPTSAMDRTGLYLASATAVSSLAALTGLFRVRRRKKK